MECGLSKQRPHGDRHRTAQSGSSGYTYEPSRLSRDCLVRKGALNSDTFRTLHQTTDTVAFVSLSLQTIVRSTLLRRASDIIFGLSAVCALSLLGGCNTYNPYLGATPTVSSSITSITPSGATAPMNHDVLLTVNGSGFVAGSNVTWNSSNSASTNLVSNVLSATQVQANIPASFLATPGTFFVGVIAPGPASGNNAGNNISNFVPFTVCGVRAALLLCRAQRPNFPLCGRSTTLPAFRSRVKRLLGIRPSSRVPLMVPSTREWA